MKKSILVLFALIVSLFMPGFASSATAAEDYSVDEVISLLENIDSLQEMQNKRSTFTVTKHYNANSASIVASHNTARQGYESYVAQMFDSREAAKAAYESLSDEEKALIDSSLSAKLNDTLDTVLSTKTYPVTEADDEYIYEIVSPGFMAYEVSSSYIRTGDVAGTLILVDTTKTGDSWTPDSKYAYGESNYELTYCCDLLTLPQNGTHYKRTNLENSNYYDSQSAEKIRAIVEISYPFLTIDEMKAELVKGGMNADFVATLTRSDLITSVQMAIWAFANVNDANFDYDNVTHYGGTLRMKNHPYIPIMHDYSNECWNWWSAAKPYRTFDEREEARVNTLVEYLCALEPKKATKEQKVISELEVVKTELISKDDETYYVTMYCELDGGGNENDDLQITATSYSENEDGTVSITAQSTCKAVHENNTCTFKIYAKNNDKIEITLEGQQMLAKGAYFYDCGTREDSQSLVGVSEGLTEVKVSKDILFLAEMAKKPVTDIIVPDKDITLNEGEEIQITITVKPEDATNKDVVFESSDDSVVTVDKNGNVIAVGPGKTTVTITSVDNPSIKKEIEITVTAPVAPPSIPKMHHVCFGKTDGIGWYEVAVNGGDFFLQGPNSTLEVAEGSVLVVRVQDMGIDDNFTFYVNGQKVPMDPANTITVVVDGYMLIGALSMDVEVPDVDESLNWFEKLIKAIKDFFAWIGSWFD